MNQQILRTNRVQGIFKNLTEVHRGEEGIRQRSTLRRRQYKILLKKIIAGLWVLLIKNTQDVQPGNLSKV